MNTERQTSDVGIGRNYSILNGSDEYERNNRHTGDRNLVYVRCKRGYGWEGCMDSGCSMHGKDNARMMPVVMRMIQIKAKVKRC